jgi:hypothetical protein
MQIVKIAETVDYQLTKTFQNISSFYLITPLIQYQYNVLYKHNEAKCISNANFNYVTVTPQQILKMTMVRLYILCQRVLVATFGMSFLVLIWSLIVIGTSISSSPHVTSPNFLLCPSWCLADVVRLCLGYVLRMLFCHVDICFNVFTVINHPMIL